MLDAGLCVRCSMRVRQLEETQGPTLASQPKADPCLKTLRDNLSPLLASCSLGLLPLLA
jgi:hypothetical protein